MARRARYTNTKNITGNVTAEIMVGINAHTDDDLQNNEIDSNIIVTDEMVDNLEAALVEINDISPVEHPTYSPPPAEIQIKKLSEEEILSASRRKIAEKESDTMYKWRRLGRW